MKVRYDAEHDMAYYWGHLGSEGKKNTAINWSWKDGDRDKVIYACCAISA
jgi:hypothetical protein